MNLLLLAESLHSRPHNSGMGNEQIIASLKQNNHRLKVIYSGNEQISPNGEGVDYHRVIQQGKVKEKKFFSFITAFRSKKKRPELFQQQTDAWIKGISEAISETNTQYDLAFVLPDGLSFIPAFALSRINTGIPWIAGFSNTEAFNFRIKRPEYEENHIRFRFRIVVEQASWLISPSIRLCESILSVAPTLHSKLLYLPYPAVNISAPSATQEENDIRYPSSWFTLLYPGNLSNSTFARRFLTAFDRFIGHLPVNASPVRLLLTGSVSNEILTEARRMGLHAYIHPLKIGSTRHRELTDEASVLLHAEEYDNDALYLPAYISSVIESQKLLLALVQYRSETRRLLGEKIPVYGDANDEEEIYYALVRSWLSWKNKEWRPSYSDKILYLVSRQNFDSVMDIALRHSKNETEF